MSLRIRGPRLFVASALTAFGAVSALVQFVGQLFPGTLAEPVAITTASLTTCVGYAVVKARPLRQLRYSYRLPQTLITIVSGDLLEQPCQMAVGFSDTFDTQLEGGVISAGSLQGQLLLRRYGGNLSRLDADLEAALVSAKPIACEDREDKPLGKLNRYKIGTVAVLDTLPHQVFAVAYSRIGNDGVATSSVEALWFSLNRLWDAVFQRGQQEPVAIPLVGGGLSRIDSLDPESTLRLVLLSFVTRSRDRRVCSELQVVLRPSVFEQVDLREIRAFLTSLERAPR